MELSDIVRIKPKHRQILLDNAKQAALGGRSNVRREDRWSSLMTDQLVGQLGNYALSVYLYGSPKLTLKVDSRRMLILGLGIVVMICPICAPILRHR